MLGGGLSSAFQGELAKKPVRGVAGDPGKTGDRRRDGEKEYLIYRNIESQIADSILVVPDGLQYDARSRLDEKPRADQDECKRDRDDIVRRDHERVELDAAHGEPAEIG